MIIHSPIISGSLTFADGGTLSLPNPTTVSGSFSGSAQFSTIGSHIVPDTANTYDLGSEANYFRDLYISTGSLKAVGNGAVSFKLGGKPGGGLKITDDNDDDVDIQVQSITLKDTSGNGNNIKLKVQNGALKSNKTNNSGVDQTNDDPQTASSDISGSLVVSGSSTLSNTTVGGTLDTTGLASLDGGIDVDGAFTVANSSGNVSTTGTLSAGNTDVATLDASGLASLDGGIDVDGAFTVSDSSGNVSTSGTLAAGNTTISGILDATGLASLDGGINVADNLTVDASGNTSVGGTLDSTGLASLDGGIDVDGAFTVANSSGNVSTSGTLSVTGLTTFGAVTASGMDVAGHILPAAHNTYDLGSTSRFWRDLYLSSGSLYINGIQVLSTDGTDLTVQTDAGESLKLLETGNDTITLETSNGDITLTSSGTGNIELDAPVQIAAGNNILSSDGNAISFANDVDLGSNDIFAANLDGIISSSAITYDGDNISVAGNATITGNLTVSGTTTTVNSNTVNIGDNQIVLNSDEAGTPSQNGGIAIERGTSTNASLIWNETNDYWMSGLLGAEERIVVGAGNTSITTLGTISTGVWNGTAIATDYIANDAVTGAKIADNAINSEHYTDGSIDREHLAADIVNGSKIADESIDSEHYVDGSIDNAHLAADSVNGAKIADESINSEHYVDGSIDTAHIAADAVTYAKIQNVSATNRILGRDSAGAGNIEEITPANLRTMINVEDGATADQSASEIRTLLGTGNNNLVPAAGSAGEFLKHDGTFGTPSYTTNTDTNTQNTYSTSVISSSGIKLRLSGAGHDGNTTDDVLFSAGTNVTITRESASEIEISSTDTNTQLSTADVRGKFSEGTGVTISSGEISIGQAVGTGDGVTFASVSATGDIVAYASSDERLKDNIEVISNPIEKVQQLKGVTWDWNDNADELQQSLPNVGVIAQDVEKVLPQLVKDRDNGFKGVDYDKIVGLLIEAIKDQQTQIDELKEKLG